jgi:hypothetical protein
MLRRHVTEEVVEHVVADPDETLERDDGCTEYTALVQGGLADRRIHVVLDETRIPHRVVTVYALEDR